MIIEILLPSTMAKVNADHAFVILDRVGFEGVSLEVCSHGCLALYCDPAEMEPSHAWGFHAVISWVRELQHAGQLPAMIGADFTPLIRELESVLFASKALTEEAVALMTGQAVATKKPPSDAEPDDELESEPDGKSNKDSKRKPEETGDETSLPD